MLLFTDIEADGLLYDATTIWCIVAYDEAQNKYLIYHVDIAQEIVYPNNSIIYTNIYTYLSTIDKYKLVFHNGLAYDLLLLEKLYKYKYKIKQDTIEDTFVLSSLYYPDRDGHSLEDWGERLGYPKGNHSDWSKFSQEILDYCIRDVDVLRKVHYALEEEVGKDWDWSLAIDIEYNIADNIARQELYGVLFDQDKAEILLRKVEEEIEEIEGKALAQIPQRAVQQGAAILKVFKKNGEYTEQVNKWIEGETL